MFDRRTIILLAVVATVILLLLLYLNRMNENQFNWDETYNVGSIEPYGASAFYNFTQNYFEDERFENLFDLENKLPLYQEEKGNYVFLGYGMYLDSAKVERLLEFVNNGNNAFISARFLPADFAEHIFSYENCEFDFSRSFSFYEDTTASLSTIHPRIKNKTKFKYIRNHKAVYTQFQYVNWYNYCRDEAKYLELGYINDSLANFVRVPYGEGFIYLHSTPFVFSNYHVLKNRNRQYVNKVLAHLDEGTIYYDRQNNVNYSPPRIDATGGNNRADRPRGPTRGVDDKTPLEYILSKRGLAWAWYMILATGVLYLIFRAKRRQRIIPVLEQNTNTSLEYVETIGMLYWQQNDHRQLALQQMRLFVNQVKTRYHILLKNVDEPLVKRLAAVSNVPQEHLQKIFDSYKTIKNNPSISEKELTKFYQLIEYYYKNCK